LSKGVHSIKIDTHRENKSMQRLLKKNGFEYCGIIYLKDKSERIAFEKTLI
ncbi:MAG TPA: GNAT family N-acetyltransferase, partial [Clostridiaceae bacterium]|nr:GNAT family N-acetyltransferase [Clostridiaceae bacterium]HBX49430.1 GNAT family N-acetyltransferase [Clostridiaceae bacterium]